MSLEKGCARELRCKSDVEQILLRYPNARIIDFYGFNDVRKETGTTNDILDKLGLDAGIVLDSTKTGRQYNNLVKAQAKINTKENFLAYGKDRGSFTLGDPNDLFMDRHIDMPIRFYDILVTGYELQPGIVMPYMTLFWPRLIKLAYMHRDLFHVDTGADGKKFVWTERQNLTVCACVSCGFDFTGF